MAIRIRVYPNNGFNAMGGYGGYGGFGGFGARRRGRSRVMAAQLQHTRQAHRLQLSAMRQIMNRDLQLAQLRTQMQLGGYGGMMTPFARPMMYNPALAGMATVGQVPPGFGMVPGMGMGMGMGVGGFGMPGQYNVVQQRGNGVQTVANNNSYHNMVVGPGFGSGSWMGNLLGGLF